MSLVIISELLFFTIVILTTLVFKTYTYRNIIVILTGISLFIKMTYLYTNEYNLAGLYDIDGHIGYIHYITQNLSLPLPDDCSECHQQSIYYLAAAPVYAFSHSLGLTEVNIYRILQLFSLLIYSTFILMGIKIINYLFNSNPKALLATSLLLFWPSGFIHASRIGNDIPLYLFSAWSLYYLLKYWQERKFSSLLISSFLAAISVITKTNGIVIVLTVLLCFLTMIYLKKIKLTPEQAIFQLVIIGFIFFLAITFNQRYTFAGMKQDHWLVGKTIKTSQSYVSNKPINYLWLDLPAYFNYPNIAPWSDEGGRQYFWNYLLKTSLFGEFQISQPLQKQLAAPISLLLLGIILSCVIYIIQLVKRRILTTFPLVTYSFLLLSSILFYKINIPCSCNNDFRFIFPILIPLTIFASAAVDFIPKIFYFRYFYLSSLILFLVLSSVFYLF